MTDSILGLHHVTATTDGAQEDVDFYAGTLGLRLVKRTVNFDNPSVYHFYYGDEQGAPGTLMTTFPYRGWGVPVGRHGAGQITVTSFSVPVGSLPSWLDRLEELGSSTVERSDRFGTATATVVDPSGLRIALVEADDERPGWSSDGLGPEAAIRGVESVSLSVRDPDASIRFLTERLGWSVDRAEGTSTRMVVGDGAPGRRLEIVHAPDAPAATNGTGTVHHVAMAVADDDVQNGIREALLGAGVQVTPVRDRQYFHSIYFREPGGVLYEIATVPPGFAIDEEPSRLGTALRLPPWEEPNRGTIERHLPSISTGP